MKKLVLITDGFPWAKSEIPFIYNELWALSKRFDVEIVARLKPQLEKSKIAVDIPESVKLSKHLIVDVDKKQKIKALGYALKTPAFYQELRKIVNADKSKAVLKEMYDYITSTYLFMDWLKKNVDIDSVDIFYTYWNSYAALGLAIEKNKHKYKLVSRTHRYDLYNERTIYFRQYFKEYVDEKLDKLYFIAEHGKKYYLEHFAHSDLSKYVMNNIGVVSANNIPHKSDDRNVHIVSCSNVIEVKRVNLIVEALAQIDDINVTWSHMGAGPKFDELKELCVTKLDGKSNITYELLGRLDNKEVRKYYDEHYVDFFLTTSASEGSPVSIQEALAYGIPVVGTDVGDVPVLVVDNGILLKTDPSIQEIAGAIRNMSVMDMKEKEDMRQKAYHKWETQYNVVANAEAFVEMLRNLTE